jgi:hypothetical protein
MDLKLKDEITKMLIGEPGLSISQLAKRTGNYYSYTHKVVSEMESLGLIEIEKIRKGKREITICKVKEDYKQRWIMDLRKFMKALMKDAEVKAAFLLMYLFVAFTFVQKLLPAPRPEMLAMGADMSARAVQETISTGLQLGVETLLIIIIPLLLLVWLYRKKKK